MKASRSPYFTFRFMAITNEPLQLVTEMATVLNFVVMSEKFNVD